MKQEDDDNKNNSTLSSESDHLEKVMRYFKRVGLRSQNSNKNINQKQRQFQSEGKTPTAFCSESSLGSNASVSEGDIQGKSVP